MTAIQADVYALEEIVNYDSLASIVRGLPGGYDFLVSPYGSLATSPSDPDYPEAQKLALVYRRDRVRNPHSRALMRSSSTAYYNFASGRFPFQIDVEMLCLDSVWRPFTFIVLHAKAMTDGSSCSRRMAGCHELKDTLDRYFPHTSFLLLGDFNDDLDVSNCSSATESNYAYMIDDSTHYVALTLPLSRTGAASTAGYSSMIDHVVASDEMAVNYVAGSAEILKDFVRSVVPSYSSTVSDHFPVRTKYLLQATPSSVRPSQASELTISPNPARDFLTIRLSRPGLFHAVIFDMQGRCLARLSGSDHARVDLGHFQNGSYVIGLQIADGTMLHQRFSLFR